MIKALGNIKHNGTLYKAGDIFSADEASEKILIQTKVAVPADGEEPKAAPKAVKSATRSEKPDATWTKVKLIGFARGLGLKVEDTLTRKELLEAIKNAPPTPPVSDEEVPAVTVNPNAPAPETPAE